ncbi:MAG: ABC transporter ATP-binding protein [Alphaproteobacteria bacterium]
MTVLTPKPAPADTTKALMQRLWRDYMAHYKLKAFFAILALLLVAGLNGAQAYLIGPAIDDGIMGQDMNMVLIICAAVLGVGIIKGSADYVQSNLLSRIGSDLVAKLQASMMKTAIHADVPQIHSAGSSNFVARFLSDSYIVRDATMKSIIGIAKDLMTILAMIGVMLWTSWEMAIAIIFVFPLSVVPIIWIGRKTRKLSHQVQANLGDMAGLLDDFFKSIRIVKAYSAEPLATRQSQSLFDHQGDLHYSMAEIKARTSPILETFGSFAVVMVILLGSWRVGQGENTTGQVMSFISALLMSYHPLRSLANLNATLQQGLAASIRCFNMIDMKPFVEQHKNPITPPTQFDVAFKHVDFAYEQAAMPAVSKLSFAVDQGKMLALVGPSGAGKSTIINLLLRLYDPNQGQVEIGGKPIHQLGFDDLRSSISLVAQEPGILDDSVAHNIALCDIANDHQNMDRKRVIEAAKAAEAHDFIMALPDQYDTVLGEMGNRLSGGQRQRLAIARAIYKDAPILLLDEATSALDSETERAIQTALKRLMQGRTVIVIAHRLSTIIDADQILVLQNGKLVEQGNHQQLLSDQRLYAQLYHLQFKEAV